MPKKLFFVDVDLNGNKIQNAVADSLATAPSNPAEGQFYYDSTDKTLKYYNGTEWVSGDYKRVAEIDEVTAAALNDLNSRLIELDNQTQSAISSLSDDIVGLQNQINNLPSPDWEYHEYLSTYESSETPPVTILASVHNCGSNPMVKAYLNNEEEVAINVSKNGSGDLTLSWKAIPSDNVLWIEISGHVYVGELN